VEAVLGCTGESLLVSGKLPGFFAFFFVNLPVIPSLCTNEVEKNGVVICEHFVCQSIPDDQLRQQPPDRPRRGQPARH